MLTVKKFSAKEDCVVVEEFDNYKVGDIVPAGKIKKTRLVSLWLKNKVRNLTTPAYNQSELESKSFDELKKIASNEYDITARSKKKLIELILERQ